MATKNAPKRPAEMERGAPGSSPREYGPSAESLAEIPELDMSKARVIRRGPLERHKHGIKMSLAALRKASGKTQVEIAEASGIAQAELSRLEHRDDFLVSTLRRYLEACGAELEMVAVFPTGHRIIVTPE